MEGGGETLFGVVVHFLGADLELDDLLVWGDDSGVDGLVAVDFGGGDVIFDAVGHGGEEAVDDAEGEVAGGGVFYDETEGEEVVDAVDVLVVFGEFFVEGVDGFDAAVGVKLDAFLL